MQVILHLSDVHFGCDKSESARASRQLALDGITSAILKLEPEWRPTIVCLSGDIAYRGKSSEYEEAARWLEKLLKELSIPPDHVVICAGNHDIDRDKVTYARPADAAEADKILSFPLDTKYEVPFEGYTGFAKKFGIGELQVGGSTSSLIGHRNVEGISFCSLNSAWFCRDNTDKEQLWIGRPILDVLETHGQVLHTQKLATAPPTIFLLHHPKDWYHDSEVHARGRTNTFDVVAGRCHLMLTGHTHGESRRPDRNGGAAYIMTGGATYADATYTNSFSLIQVHDEKFIYRTFDFDPQSAIREWRQSIEATDLFFRDSVVQGGITGPMRFFPQLADYRRACESHARKVIEAKSRALRPQGTLPHTIPAFVTIELVKLKPQMDRPDQRQQARQVRPIFLGDAMRTTRRSLLLGDLGSGKSTLAATFAIESQERNQNAIALLVPAKMLLPGTHAETLRWPSVKEFISSLTSFVNDQIFPTASGFDLQDLLNWGREVAILIDGLDEVSLSVAREIVERLGQVVDHWSTVQVLATGRPIELAGLDHSRWQLCVPYPIQDDDKHQLFVEEAIADGKEGDSAISTASLALNRLRSTPELYLMADTPLFCRLLFGGLQSGTEHETETLGDLLYQLLTKRLKEWAASDQKVSLTPQFDAEYPDAGSRMKLLSDLVGALDRDRPIREEEARSKLDALLPTIANVSKAQLADQALRSFQSVGLIVLEGGRFELSLRSFDDLCRGYAIADTARTNPARLLSSNQTEWRSFAFAATVVRRLGWIEQVRPALCDCIKDILSKTKDVPAAAYIVAEAQDHALAVCFIEKLAELGRRPLWFSYDDPIWPQAAQAIAESLRLASDQGFDWFFREYLDPQYPFVFAGSQLTEEVFNRWVALHIGKLTSKQQTDLTSMIVPHSSADSHQASSLVPVLALLLPQEFEAQKRLRYCIRLLESPLSRDAAEAVIRGEIDKGDPDRVLNLFPATISNWDGAQNATLLYLSLRDGRPPTQIVRAVITQKRGRRPDRQHLHTVQKLKERLGDELFQRYCRWYLFEGDTALSAGAAIQLFDLGERRLALLASPLIQALHDGGYLPQAEDILSELIAGEGHEATRVLATYIGETRHDGLGGHSGWWRLLFRFIHDPNLRGPELLVHCMRGVGEFLLARYPEIRNSFRELVLSPQYERFRAAIHDALNDAEPEIRHGAAMVLVTSDPEMEGQALEIVVRFKSHRSHGAWFEWERYCLTLRFGTSVLSYLRSRLPFFSGPAQVFALAILVQNGIELDDAQFREFIEGALTTFYGSPIADSVRHSERIQKALLDIADTGKEEAARKAAELLLGNAKEKLDAKHYARCRVLTLDGSEWRNPEFAAELERMRNYPEYATLVVQEAEQQVQRGFKRALIEQIYEAQQNPSLWEDIVWNAICTPSPGSRIGSQGQWILEFMLKVPDSRQAIGKVARKFLFDARISQGFNTDESSSWLALLAHEGGELSAEELGTVVDRIDPIDKCAFVPLVTRLGRAPGSTRQRRHSYSALPQISASDQISPETATFERFLEFARPGGQFHPNFCSLIEQSLYNDPFSEEQLQTLTKKGEHGTLVAIVLAFAYGRSPDPDWAIAVLGVKPPGAMQNEPCLRSILSRWENILFAAKADPTWRASYLEKLKEAIKPSQAHLSEIASEMLSIDPSLTPEHLDILLKHLIHLYFDDQKLCATLSKLLADLKNEELLKDASSSVDSALADLDLQPWNADEMQPKDAGAFLMFPLLRWRITGLSDIVSRRVFLRGLKMALLPARRPEGNLAGWPSRFVGIEDVAPLMQTASKAIIEDAIQHGSRMEDVELRALCRLFRLDDIHQAGPVPDSSEPHAAD
ncbi:MAG TPA: metallophosphoesterase [Terriglobales bacterium]|nr:metallophosphoesterase [Terriglobales bacterium]